jgi:hypothetical protein
MTDAIDLSTVKILNALDVRSWPATADITRVEVTPDNVRFAFTKQDGPDRWPDQHYASQPAADSYQYTVWLFLRISGQWFASAFIDMWHGRDGVGDSISDFPKNWYYDAARWAPMTGHIIQPGELIGFMLTAGDARNGADSSVHERSHVVTIARSFECQRLDDREERHKGSFMSDELPRVTERLRQSRDARRKSITQAFTPNPPAAHDRTGTWVAGQRVFDTVTGQEGHVVVVTRENVVS